MTDLISRDSYADYLAVNEGCLSRFDYFYMVRERKCLNNDFITSFAALFNPTLFVREDGCFVEENYTDAKYQKLMRTDLDDFDISYWVNMVEVTSILGDISYEEAVEIGSVIRECWNAKLDRQFPGSGSEARLLLDEELDEVWVTLCKV